MPGDSVIRNDASGILTDDLPSCLKYLEYAQGSTVYVSIFEKSRLLAKPYIITKPSIPRVFHVGFNDQCLIG